MPSSYLFMLASLASVSATSPDGAGATSFGAGPQDIVVVADRPHGEVVGAIREEQRLDTAAIRGLGASNLADILAQIAGLTGGSQSRSGDGPVILVNGRRISSFDEVRNLPPEAIERVDILPEEAALRLGYPARSKPVNIVLKPYYASVMVELEDRLTTIGLRSDFNTEINAVRIKGENRLTLDLQYQTGDAITEAKRGVLRPLDALAANRAGLISALGGGAILPLAQSYAAVPSVGRSLSAFASAPVADETSAWRTLTPASGQLTINSALARALGGGRNLSVNVKYDRLAMQEMLGPAIGEVDLPITSPFAVPLRLRMIVPDGVIQTRSTRTDTIHVGTQLSGVGRWRWSVAGNADHVSLARDTRGGMDSSLWQQAVTNGSIGDVFAAPAANLVLEKANRHSSSRDGLFGLDSFLSGGLFEMPAGRANLTLSGKTSHETLNSIDDQGARKLTRTSVSAQASLDLPLLASSSPIGALDGGISLSVDRWSDAGTVQGYGANVSWKPRKSLSVLVSALQDGMAPTMAQLGAPLNVTPQASFFDFTSGRSITASQTTGGNGALVADLRRILKIQSEWKAAKSLTLTATYTNLTDRSPLVAFAGITRAFEAAYAGRIARDADGTIIGVDARPFNAAHEDREDLRLAAVFSRNFGGGSGPSVPGKGGFGGGHNFGASGTMLQFSLVDTIRLRDQLMLVSGGPAYDLVSANPLGESARTPRHRVDAQFSGTRNGWGLRAGGVWTSGGQDGVGSAGNLRFDDRFAFNFRLFWFPDRSSARLAQWPYAKGLRFLLAVDNLFGSWQRVTNQSGVTPLAYQRWILDPIGPTFRFSIRKTFE